MQRLPVSLKKWQAQLRIRLLRPYKEGLAGVHLSTAPEASARNAPELMCLLPCRYAPAHPLQRTRKLHVLRTSTLLVHTIRCACHPSSHAHQTERYGSVQAVGNWLSAYTNMGVKAYQSQHSSRQPTADQAARLLTSHEAAGRTTHQSNALFSWLFKACLAYQLYEWLQVRGLLKAFHVIDSPT